LTDQFRQKLLNWFCSLLVLMSTLSTATALQWLFFIPRPKLGEEEKWFFEFVFRFGEVGVVLSILLFAALIWHLSDMLHKYEEPSFGIISRLSRFPLWLLSFGLLCIFTALIISQALHSTCPPIPARTQFGFYAPCYPQPPVWLYIAFYGASAWVAFLMLWKFMAALISRRPKQTK